MKTYLSNTLFPLSSVSETTARMDGVIPWIHTLVPPRNLEQQKNVCCLSDKSMTTLPGCGIRSNLQFPVDQTPLTWDPCQLTILMAEVQDLAITATSNRDFKNLAKFLSRKFQFK